MTRFLPSRRHVLTTAAAGVATLTLGGRAFAQGPGDRKLVLVILRGGMDGLGAIAPLADPAYADLRGQLALSPDDALPLADGFSAHPSLANLHGMFTAGEAALVHAVHPGHDSRSHFDAQDLLEGGVNAKSALAEGWLNRALTHAAPGEGGPREGLAIGSSIPLALQGPAPVSSWAPNVLPDADPDTLDRLNALYAYDPVLLDALDAALAADEVANENPLAPARRANNAFVTNAEAAARLMTAPGGAGAVVMSLGGWDTHNGQGAAQGRLANALRQLDAGLGALKTHLGDAWSRTAIVVASEFGRTVRVNGTRGTDHGTGGAAFVLGGAVRSGRVIGDWPGLARLHDDRDLMAANDLRSVFKGVLRDHWGVSRGDLDTHVFPDSASAAPLDGLIA